MVQAALGWMLAVTDRLRPVSAPGMGCSHGAAGPLLDDPDAWPLLSRADSWLHPAVSGLWRVLSCPQDVSAEQLAGRREALEPMCGCY